MRDNNVRVMGPVDWAFYLASLALILVRPSLVFVAFAVAISCGITADAMARDKRRDTE